MKFLIEKMLLGNDEYNKYLRLVDFNKKKYISKLLSGDYWINKEDNEKFDKNMIAQYRDIIWKSIIEDGVDLEENDFLNYIYNININNSTKINKQLDRSTIEIIKALIDSNKLNSDEKWLYENSLYQNKDTTNFYIKALTYASNPLLQSNADVKITIDDLMTDGKLKSINQIKELLSKIIVMKNRKAEQEKSQSAKEQEKSQRKEQSTEPTIKDYINMYKGSYNNITDLKSILKNIYEEASLNSPNEKTIKEIIDTLNDNQANNILNISLSKNTFNKKDVANAIEKYIKEYITHKYF